MSRRHPFLARAARAFPLVALTLGACAHQRVAVIDLPPAPPIVVAAAPLPMPSGPSPINANLSRAATVWHLRAALNVAALACRAPQEAMLASQYNALLAREKTSFAVAQAALSAEFRAGGGQWQDRYDHAMTRLYNFFSTAQAHDRFCAAAMQVMAETQTLAPGALPGYAADRLMTLDAAFVQSAARRSLSPSPSMSQPVIALSAAPAPNQPTARPRLELDLASPAGN